MRLGFLGILFALAAADVAAWVLAAWWLKRYRARRWVRSTSHVFFGAQTLYSSSLVTFVTVGMAGARRYMEWVPLPLEAMIYIWHMVFLPLALVTWLIVAALFAVRMVAMAIGGQGDGDVAANREAPADGSAAADPLRAAITRRDMLLASVAAVPPLIAVGATGYSMAEAWKFRVSKIRMPVAELPAGLEGMRLAHVTDLHVGRWSTRKFLDDVVDATNSLDADLVLFTGDLIDISVTDLGLAIDTAKRLRGRQGLYLIEGNHDLIDDAAAFRAAVAHEGLNFLRGSSATMEYQGTPVELLGLPWARSEGQIRQDVLSLVGRHDRGAFPILMAHHPHAFDAAAEAGLPLTLSGHTHGGQLALGREFNAGQLLFRYISGQYQRAGSRLLVSNGTGNWFPLRLGAPAEIIEITLTRA